jgi:hypothetical protein
MRNMNWSLCFVLPPEALGTMGRVRLAHQAVRLQWVEYPNCLRPPDRRRSYRSGREIYSGWTLEPTLRQSFTRKEQRGARDPAHWLAQVLTLVAFGKYRPPGARATAGGRPRPAAVLAKRQTAQHSGALGAERAGAGGLRRLSILVPLPVRRLTSLQRHPAWTLLAAAPRIPANHHDGLLRVYGRDLSARTSVTSSCSTWSAEASAPT